MRDLRHRSGSGHGALKYAFAIPFGGMLLIMLICGYKPFGSYSMLYSDMYHQYYPFFVSYRRALLSGESLLYNWDIGMGIDYLGLIAYYLGSPLNLLSVLVPESWLLSYFSLLMPLKLGFAGLFFAIFLRQLYGRDDLATAFFGAMYALCAWALGYQWNVMWLDTFALLPLVIGGEVALLRDRKFLQYTFTLFLSVVINYYIGLFTCIFVALVFFCYQICRQTSFRRFWADLGLMAVFSALAIGMTAILTLPALAALQTTQSSVNNFPEGFRLNIASENTIQGLLDAMRQVAGNMGGSLQPSFKEGLPNLYCGVGSVLLAGLFLTAREVKVRDKLCAVFLLLFLNVSFIIRQLDYIWHGFHFTNQIPYRFSFLYSFVLLYMAYRAWTQRRHFKLYQIAGAFVLTAALLSMSNDLLEQREVEVFGVTLALPVYLLYNAGFLLLHTAGLLVGLRRYKGKPDEGQTVQSAAAQPVLEEDPSAQTPPAVKETLPAAEEAQSAEPALSEAQTPPTTAEAQNAEQTASEAEAQPSAEPFLADEVQPTGEPPFAAEAAQIAPELVLPVPEAPAAAAEQTDEALQGAAEASPSTDEAPPAQQADEGNAAAAAEPSSAQEAPVMQEASSAQSEESVQDKEAAQRKSASRAYHRKMRRRSRRIALAVMGAELAATLINFAVWFPGTNVTNYPKGTDESASVIRYMQQREEGTLFYRAETTHSQTLNDGALNGYSGVSAFTSSANVRITEFMKALGYGAKNTYNRYCFEESSPVANLFLNLKYMIDRDGHDRSSSYFKQVYQYGDVTLLENTAYLPLGFLTESALADTDFSASSDPFTVQNAVFSAATGMDVDVFAPVSDSALEIVGEGASVVRGSATGSCNYSDCESNATVTYTFTAEQAGFACIYVNLPKRNTFSVSVNGTYLYTETISLAQMLAVQDVQAGDTIEICVQCSAGESSTMNITAAILDRVLFLEGYTRLAASQWELTTFQTTLVEGTIDCDRDGLLYTSIPENGNWTVYVDDVETEYTLVGECMISVPLTQGTHTVTFRYHNAAFSLGWKVSAVCLAVVVLLAQLVYKPDWKRLLPART